MKNLHTIHPVTTPFDVRRFLSVPDAIYRGDANWVKPLDNDILAVFNSAKNERFKNGDAARWLLLDEAGEAVGRIAAFYNCEDAAREEQPTGGCGFFESPDDQTAANMLFDTARNWLADRGMEAMDGSVNFGDRMQWWGVLVEGFSQPLYAMNYNPPYYAALFENYGFQNYFNQHTYLRPLSPEVVLDDILCQKAERLFESSEYVFRTFDPRRKEQMARDFMAVYNSGWANFEGVKPLTYDHALAMIRTMSQIVDPDVLLLAYYISPETDEETAIGFFVMVPDLNRVIGAFRGKLGLLQKLQLLWALKVSKRIDRVAGLIFGVAAEFQGKGVESGLIRKFEQYTIDRRAAGKEQYKTLEMGWIGDFNPVMMRVCEAYVNAVKHKRHVTYRYLFDRQKPFTRCPRLGRKKSTKIK